MLPKELRSLKSLSESLVAITSDYGITGMLGTVKQ